MFLGGKTIHFHLFEWFQSGFGPPPSTDTAWLESPMMSWWRLITVLLLLVLSSGFDTVSQNILSDRFTYIRSPVLSLHCSQCEFTALQSQQIQSSNCVYFGPDYHGDMNMWVSILLSQLLSFVRKQYNHIFLWKVLEWNIFYHWSLFLFSWYNLIITAYTMYIYTLYIYCIYVIIKYIMTILISHLAYCHIC